MDVQIVNLIIKKTTAEYIEHLKSKNKNILCLEQYINSATKIKHQCKICKYKWYAYPNALLSTRKIGCPVCNISKGEQRITNILKTNNIIFEQQRTYEDLYFKSVKHPLRFDFYLPLYNLLIEYNGKQHYEHIEHFTTKELFQEQQIRDNLKIEYCIKNNIELKIIRYDEDIQLEVKKIINILKQE